MIFKKFKNLTQREIYHKIFDILNYVQNNKETKLTISEIRIITEFMMLDNNTNTKMFYRFSTGNRKRVLDIYNEQYNQILSNRNLNAILTNLRKKGLIIKDEDGMNYLSPYITDKILNQEKFEINISFEI